MLASDQYTAHGWWGHTFHRRGVLGQAMDPDPDLQLVWGARTRVSRAMWVAGLDHVDSWYAQHCLLDSWPPAVRSVPRG